MSTQTPGRPHILRDRLGNLPDEHYPSLTQAEKARRKKAVHGLWQIKKEKQLICPKCQSSSGDDWSQCNGACPMPMSPHYVG